jgi:hypothetical protein
VEPIIIIGGILLVICLVGFVMVQRRVGLTPVFLAAYRSEMGRSGSPERALKEAMLIFQRRAPFNVLIEDDIDYLAMRFSNLPDPTWLMMAFKDADEKHDASSLKDRDWVDNLYKAMLADQQNKGLASN